jgi:hypothetical protein
MKRFFEWLSNVINGAESSFLNFLGALVPYAVPVIPAYLTFYHTRDMMDFPDWVAWTAAFAVEVLGMTSVSTAIRFYRHNQKYKREENKAPFKLAMGVYVFYIVVVLVVNIILEIVDGSRNHWVIIAIGLFSLLSFPSGVLVSIRAQYRDFLEDREAQRIGGGKKPIHRPNHASDHKDAIRSLLENEYASSGRILSPKEITASLKLDHDKAKGFVSTFTKNWKSEKGIGSIEF